jgi:hypothetical protein
MTVAGFASPRLTMTTIIGPLPYVGCVVLVIMWRIVVDCGGIWQGVPVLFRTDGLVDGQLTGCG